MSVRDIFQFVLLFVALGFSVTASANADRQLRDELVGRSERYIESIRQRIATLDPVAEESAERRARAVVAEGFCKLRTAEGVGSTAPGSLSLNPELFRRLGKSPNDPAVVRTAEFLRGRYHVPTPLEKIAHLAQPEFRAAKRLLVLLNRTQPRPENSPNPLPILQPMHAVATASGKNIDQLLLAVRSLSPSANVEPFLTRFESDIDLLEGFTLIAQTTVRRE